MSRISKIIKISGSESATMDSDLTSATIDLSSQDVLAIQAVYTGSPTGQLKIQRSVDNETFNDLIEETKSIDAAGSHIWDIPATAIPYFRIFYRRTDGTGTLQIFAHFKRHSRG